MPEPIATFHDELMLDYNSTGIGAIINEQRMVFAIKRSGHVFPMALFVRGGADGISVVGVMQPITGRDSIILCSGADYVLTGVSEGSSREFGIEASDIFSRGIQLATLIPDFERALGAVASGEYAPMKTQTGHDISMSRISATFPNGAVMHFLTWHDAETDGRAHGHAHEHEHAGGGGGGDMDLLGEAASSPRAAAAQMMQTPAADGTDGGDAPEEDIDEADLHQHERSERSGKSMQSAAFVFRKAVLDGRTVAPLPLRRLRTIGIVVVCVTAAAAIALISVAATNLSAVLASTTLVWSGADRALDVAQMGGMALVMRAAAMGTMSVDLNGGNIITATQASLLSDSQALQAAHTAQLATTVGTTAYADGMELNLTVLEPAGPVTTRMTLARAIYEGIAAMRAMAYLPVHNITDSDPSTYFLTNNFVAISNAAAAAVVFTGATVSSTSNFYNSPVVIFVAVCVLACLVGCVVVYVIARRALAFRMPPLERMSKLPNSVLQRLESAAARGVAAAERTIECTDTAADRDTDSQDDNEADETDWRYVSLSVTSKDQQKGTTERPRERIIFGCLMVAPLLVSAIVFSVLAMLIWTGIQNAGVSSNTLTSAILTEVSTRQAVYFSMLSATMYDGVANATITAANLAQADALSRVNTMFFGANGDAAADTALQAIHFGDMCATLALPPAEASRCGSLAGGVCHSGLQATFQSLLGSAETLLSDRAQLAFPASPSPSQLTALQTLMNAKFVTDMRILELVEVVDAMQLDGQVRGALVQSAVNSAVNTGTVLVVVLIGCAIAYEVCCRYIC